MTDGSGDQLAAMLHQSEARRGATKPLVVLVHGLTGCEESFYIRCSAMALLRRGYPVMRVNLRGAGPSRTKSKYQYHAGRTEDLHDLLAGLNSHEPSSTCHGVVLVGFSLGGNLVIKYLSERRRAPFAIKAAISVSAPIELKAAQKQIMRPRNRIYHAYLLDRMKTESLAAPAAVSEAEKRAIQSARSIYQFDDRFVAPRNGFEGAEDYYRQCSSKSGLATVSAPLLMIAAKDDPLIPASIYEDIECRPDRPVTLLLPDAGGHVGFHGSGSRTPWHDRCIDRFLLQLGC